MIFSRLIYLLLCGLALACIVHIIIILTIPFVGKRDIARQIVTKFPERELVSLDESSGLEIASLDPFVKTVVCKFDLEELALLVTGTAESDFWTAAVYNARGEVIYSLNDRTAIGGQVRLLIVNPIQMATIRQVQPDELETAVVIEMPEQRGFVAIRSLAYGPSQSNHNAAGTGEASCEDYEPFSQIDED